MIDVYSVCMYTENVTLDTYPVMTTRRKGPSPEEKGTVGGRSWRWRWLWPRVWPARAAAPGRRRGRTSRPRSEGRPVFGCFCLMERLMMKGEGRWCQHWQGICVDSPYPSILPPMQTCEDGSPSTSQPVRSIYTPPFISLTNLVEKNKHLSIHEYTNSSQTLRKMSMSGVPRKRACARIWPLTRRPSESCVSRETYLYRCIRVCSNVSLIGHSFIHTYMHVHAYTWEPFSLRL